MDTNVRAVNGFESGVATVAFVDLAGFSAITDIYGDASAIAVLERFEELVRQELGGLGPPIKWIGDEAMFGFPDPATALQVFGRSTSQHVSRRSRLRGKCWRPSKSPTLRQHLELLRGTWGR